MILQVDTNCGPHTYYVRDKRDAVKVLCDLHREGYKLLRWEVIE